MSQIVHGMTRVRRQARSILAFVSVSLLLPTGLLAAQKQTRQVPVDSLIYDLKNPDPIRRKEAATHLGNNKVKRAVPDLVEVAGDADPSVRREIIIALDKIRDLGALPAFVQLSGDPEKDIREKCIHAIVNLYLQQEGGFGVAVSKVANFFNPWSDEWADAIVDPWVSVDVGATTALTSRLRDDDDDIRTKATRAIGILRAKASIPELLESLSYDRSNAVRFEAVRALRKIGDPSVGRNLTNYIGYNDSKVRNEVVISLGRLRYKEAAGELQRLYERESSLPLKQSDRQLRQLLLEALSFIADLSSKELLEKERYNPDDTLRLHAIEGLARIGDASIVTELSRQRLQEKDAKIRTALAYALYRMGRKEYLDEIIKALSDRKTNSAAKQYLVDFGSEELPDLHAQLRTRNLDAREALAEVLGLVGDSSSIPYLQELSKDDRGQIAAQANLAIRRIYARNQSQ